MCPSVRDSDGRRERLLIAALALSLAGAVITLSIERYSATRIVLIAAILSVVVYFATE